MSRLRISFLIMLFLLTPPHVSAYELYTHSRITYQAYQRSMLPTLGDRYGLNMDGQTPLANLYFDQTMANPRTAWPFEARRITRDGVDPLSVAGWLMRGAVREDDLTANACRFNTAANWIHGNDLPQCNPQDDPNPMIRVNRHFLDPLSGSGILLFADAATWATGATNAFTDPNVADTTRNNHYSIMDARWAMYYALTGRDGQAHTLTPDQRNAWWATTFRSLGDAMHLVEDMAQPQHTRSELHPGSAFEAYMDVRAQGLRRYNVDGKTVVGSAPLPFSTPTGFYDKPQFSRYSDFFSSGLQVAPADRIGLADYSNRGFFTEGRNFNDPNNSYPNPPSVRSLYTEELLTDPDYQLSNAVIKFLDAVVPDPLLGPTGSLMQPAIRMTTETSFTTFLGTTKRYSMNRFNFDDQASMLIPRATAYAAGLLDYFFRGQIDCAQDLTLVSGCRIRNQGTETLFGTFEIYYEAADGTMVLIDTWGTPIGGMPTSDPLDPTDGIAATFTPPTAPAPMLPGHYTLVFHGDMGAEQEGVDSIGAVAGKVFKLDSGALYVLMANSYGLLQTFREDLDGVRPLKQGYDPFEFWEQLEYINYYFLFNHQFFAIDNPSAYKTKQVEFGANPLAYRTRSTIVMVPSGFSYELDGYFPTDDAQSLTREPGYSWYARDPVWGTFILTTTIQDFTKVTFTRTYRDSAGIHTVTGNVAAPSPPQYGTNIGLDYISPEGTLTGLAYGGYDFTITLAAAPTGSYAPTALPNTIGWVSGVRQSLAWRSLGTLGMVRTANLNDLVYADPYTGNKSFRGINLGRDVACDWSPLGEVFVATRDGSLIVHEPKNGRMPVFTMPPGYTQILGAIWM